MCGISITPLEKSDLHELTQHRGITSHVVTVGDYSLCHHWLPIQTSINGPQLPIEINGWHLLYVGELFDYPVEVFESDTAYILNLMSILEPLEVLEHLHAHDGFFAAVITDGKDFYWTTDHLGKKQLYFDSVEKIWCSEIRGFGPRRYNIDMGVVGEWAAAGYSSKLPFYTGKSRIKKSVPGGIYKNNVLLSKGKPKAPAETDLISMIQHSVNVRTIGHERIACFVSGGLDSSIIAYHLSKQQIPVAYYTIENGETEFVEILEAHLGITVTRLQTDPASVEMALRANELPFDLGSMIPQYELFAAVKERVIITGDGADEMFGGYRRNKYYDSWEQDMNELTNYHLPRIDRMASWFTKEARQPFLSNAIYLHCKQWKHRDKAILRDKYRGKLPVEIVHRKKMPLKSGSVIMDEKIHRYRLIQEFIKQNSKTK